MRKISKIFTCLLFLMLVGCSSKDLKMPDFIDKNANEVIEFANKHNLKYEIKEDFDENIKENNVVWQNIEKGTILTEESNIIITKSLGKNMTEEYIKYHVDESGNVPIMMYHGISNLKDADTGYTGGNVDRDGYTRTAESFRRDLEFYYDEGYRMIRLNDYINGDIDVPLGKSPIILTFDDGLENNIRVTGLDDKGNIIIDENSAIGILEAFKKKHPDATVTATFFVNGGLFRQSKYDEKILNWLVDNGYDVGNHTWSHVDFTTVDSNETVEEVGSMYKKLDKLLGDKYVKIIALPFGSPYDLDHKNFKYILNGEYDGFKYETFSALRVGWEADYSPFNVNFNSKFLKRIRAYDNKGVEFDIEMNFKILKNNRYISDGNVNTVVVPKDKKEKINEGYDKKYIYYELTQ